MRTRQPSANDIGTLAYLRSRTRDRLDVVLQMKRHFDDAAAEQLHDGRGPAGAARKRKHASERTGSHVSSGGAASAHWSFCPTGGAGRGR